MRNDLLETRNKCVSNHNTREHGGKKPGGRTVLINVEHSLGGATLTKGATVYGNATNHIQ